MWYYDIMREWMWALVDGQRDVKVLWFFNKTESSRFYLTKNGIYCLRHMRSL